MTEEPEQSLAVSCRVDLLESALGAGHLDRRQFLRLCAAAGVSASTAFATAAEIEAIRKNQTALGNSLQSEYDFIVCGAGTSGCVVAARLASNPAARVLLIEAGGMDDAPGIADPSVWFTNIGSPLDWSYMSQPTPAMNGRSVVMPMGRVLGGGSSINAMVYARGHRSDFDDWAKASGDEAWNYENVLKRYKRLENWQGKLDAARRGQGGPVWIAPLANPSPLATGMQTAAARMGIPAFDDMNGEMMEGEGGSALPNVIIKDGRRQSMVSAYLRPVLAQPNITVLTRAVVTRLKFRGDQIDAVELAWQGKTHAVKGGKVVLSLGAINTPKVLMLSGIGDERLLKRIGIRSVNNLKGVGQNYQDHPIVEGCLWETKVPMAPRNNAAEGTLFWKSNPRLEAPDLQPFLLELPVAGARMKELYKLPENGFTFAPGLVRPKSYGAVTLRSSDPLAAPVLQPNFLKHPDDVEALVRCMELCREIGNSPEMSEFVKREVAPGAVSKEGMRNLIRNATESYGHSTGTCRMGTDDMAVVDAKLRVRGISGLHVADGSIMPRITTGNTMAPCIMIGERIAEILA